MNPEARASATREALERSREYPESATPHTGNRWYPQYDWSWLRKPHRIVPAGEQAGTTVPSLTDRKSTRLNSSHLVISYAVFCLKKKKKQDWWRSGPTSISNRTTMYRSPSSWSGEHT